MALQKLQAGRECGMKEIGGYIELDRYKGEEYHPRALALNCGRACLAYLIRQRKIRKIYLPRFLCSSVAETCHNEGIPYEYYSIDEKFRPLLNGFPDSGEWIYIVNYYGQIKNEELRQYRQRFQRIIVDHTQAFFHPVMEGIDTIYTCRKFFGVTDGAYLYTQAEAMVMEQDCSYERMRFLMGRFEKNANEFYGEFTANEKQLFADGEVRGMSELTHNLLRAVDYRDIAERRTENFSYLHQKLGKRNVLELEIPYGAFMYPFYTEDGPWIREELRKKKIYIPTLWPNVLRDCGRGEREYRYAERILPLPVDQRYTLDDMAYVIEKLEEYIS